MMRLGGELALPNTKIVQWNRVESSMYEENVVVREGISDKVDYSLIDVETIW